MKKILFILVLLLVFGISKAEFISGKLYFITSAAEPYQTKTQNFENQSFSFKEQHGDYQKASNLVYGANEYFNSFTLDETELIYDTKDKIYYFSISAEQMNSNITKQIRFIPKNEDYKINIENQNITSGLEFTFPNVTADKIFKIQIVRNNNVLQTINLIFTGLPIVQLYTEGKSWSNTFSSGKIKVTENDKTQTGELLNADIRYRGANALNYSKKSFAVKLKDENNESIDRSYFGLRDDNYWILDAMAADLSRMRNRVATDLWNDFSVDPYFKNQERNMINGTRGQFVEVFLDDEYWGLYCMTERIDRKQLKLKKYQEETQNIRGVIYKAEQWSDPVMMGKRGGGNNRYFEIPNYSNTSDSWGSYEIKFPDFEDGELITWKPLYNLISFVVNNDDLSFRNFITEKIDFPVWLDYYLFLELIYARDNHGKNIYYYIYDINDKEKFGIVPWDLDGTFGRSWDRSQTDSQVRFIDFLNNHGTGEHYLYQRLRENNVNNYNLLLKTRYDELRFNYFSKEKLLERFENYLDLFTVSGAKNREKTRWNGTNSVSIQLDEEIDYILDWISGRVDFLNEQYGEPIISPPSTLLDNIDYAFQVYPNPVVETLSVNNAEINSPVWIYSENGVCLYNGVVPNSVFTIDFSSYPAGRYFLKIGNKGKMVIKTKS